MPINNGIINQKGTPAFYSDIFANRPAFGYAGRVFISTDTGAIYEDTGTSWTLIADAGAGTTGTLQQVTTNGNTTTLGIQVQGIDINDGAGTGANNIAIGSTALSLNTTGFSNTAVGSLSLPANTTGNYNTALGMQSLYNNTTGANNTALGQGALALNTTASNNTAVGNASLSANTTGASNTAIGSSALNGNTTASFNTAIGYQSLYLNTTGASQTAIGSGSLQNNTTGTSNTAIGHSSLGANLTGSYNASLGISTLAANTTGSYNVAIGQQTLLVNTTGQTNTGVGNSVLSANISGQANTAIGAGALQSNTSANSNTAIGVSALGSSTTGTLNTAIGYTAGGSITTGSNNTIIGNYGGTTTLANNIVLSDGAGNVRLFSDPNGLIGIGQAVGTPGGQLDIHTTQTYALVLNGTTTNNAYQAFSSAGVGKWRIGNTYNAGANSFNIFNLTTSSNAITITSSNQVGFGVTTIDSTISVDIQNLSPTSNNVFLRVKNNNSSEDCGIKIAGTFGTAYEHTIGVNTIISSADLCFSNSNTAGYRWFIDGNTKLMVASTGNVLIGTTTDDTTAKLQVNGEIRMYGSTLFRGMSSNTLQLCGGTSSSNIKIDGSVEVVTIDTNGVTRLNIASTGVTTISNLAGTGSRAVLADASGNLSAPVSDISVKENINTIGYGLNEILKMNPVWFDYINEYKNYGEGRQNGNIAQEMESIIPEAVFITPSTGKMGINYDQLHAVYIKAIQELKAEIDALKNN